MVTQSSLTLAFVYVIVKAFLQEVPSRMAKVTPNRQACARRIYASTARGTTMVNTKSIDEVLSRATAAEEVPGVVAMAATEQGVVYEGAFGKRELGKDAPMTLDTVVWIASMTKAITATAAMQLIERGKLKLEQPASELVT